VPNGPAGIGQLATNADTWKNGSLNQFWSSSPAHAWQVATTAAGMSKQMRNWLFMELGRFRET
jgi:hypothetical protein